MVTDARIRIDSHRLMQKAEVPLSNIKVNSARDIIIAQKKLKEKRWKRRAVLHVIIFALSFILSLGVAVLAILLFVRSDAPLTQLLAFIMFAFTFVITFAGQRIFILHYFLVEYPNKDEDPGISHHVSKSIAYGFVALVLAFVIMSLIIKVAERGIF